MPENLLEYKDGSGIDSALREFNTVKWNTDIFFYSFLARVDTVSKTQEGLNPSFIALATTLLSKVVIWLGLGSYSLAFFFLFFFLFFK